MVHVSALSLSIYMCVYLYALHAQKPQKLLALFDEDLAAALSFFFLNPKEKSKQRALREGLVGVASR